MIEKYTYTYFGLRLCALFALLIGLGCSSAQQQEELQANDNEYEEGQENQYEDNENLNEGNGQGNYADQENENASLNGDYAQNGGDANSDTTNDTQEDYEVGEADDNLTQGANGEYAQEGIANNEYADGALNNNLTQNTGDNIYTADTSENLSGGANYAADPAAGGDVTQAPQPAVAGGTAPIPGGRVRYVREGGVEVYDAPGGSVISTLEQGEHPVTWEEGGFLRITQGMYVPFDAMSDTGVGRAQYGSTWQ